MEQVTDSKLNAAVELDLVNDAGRPGWIDPTLAVDDMLMTIGPADIYGLPGWHTVMLRGKPVRHFPTPELASAFIRGRDRTYSLAELAEATAVAYSRGLAMSRVGTSPLTLGPAREELFSGLSLPGLLARMAFSHEPGDGEPGWGLAEDQSATALQVLADRERMWQALLVSIDELIAWLATHSDMAWPTCLAQSLTAAAAPLRCRHVRIG